MHNTLYMKSDFEEMELTSETFHISVTFKKSAQGVFRKVAKRAEP